MHPAPAPGFRYGGGARRPPGMAGGAGRSGVGGLAVLAHDVGECDATVTDMVEDTVDYGSVCERVALVAQQRSYKTLERLCSAIADRLLGDYRAMEVWVKATKPEPPIALPVEEVSVEVWRQTGDG